MSEIAASFQPLWGAPIETSLIELVALDDRIMLELVMLPEAFARVVALGSFGMLEEVLKTGHPRQLEIDRFVRLRLRLKPGPQLVLESLAGDALAHVLAALTREHPLSTMLRHAEAWLLCTATQRIEVSAGTVDIGFQTKWID